MGRDGRVRRARRQVATSAPTLEFGSRRPVLAIEKSRPGLPVSRLAIEIAEGCGYVVTVDGADVETHMELRDALETLYRFESAPLIAAAVRDEVLRRQGQP